MKTKLLFLRKITLLLIFFCFVLISQPVSAQVNIVTNPSFESNDSALSNTAHAPVGSVSNVNYDANTSYTGWTGRATAINNYEGLNAYEGFIYAELNTTGLSQVLSVTPGVTYYVCGRGGNVGTIFQETMGIYIDGVLITTAGNSGALAFSPSPALGSFVPTTSTVTLNIRSEAGTPGADLIYVGTSNTCPTNCNAGTTAPILH